MYDHKKIEKKWQEFWEKNKTFKVENDFSKPKYYTLDMFPYPSGAGLHVGHPEGYTANDIIARYKHANGYNVLHPMGWDAFGLPAENYAIKTGTHPKITTSQNIANFKKQIKALGFSYDWDREVDTTDPKYYKWTQWIFLKLFENGLAYEQDLPINYCPSCKTGLANEEVLNDFTCERCGTKVEKRKLRQWVLAITKYADRLLNDVDKLDWPEGIKEMQRNWIGKSEGCEFEMKKVDDETKSIRVYTTRIDTVFGMSYAVLAPDHPQVLDFITLEQKKSCLDYIEKAKQKSDQDRTAENKEKTGVFTGSYVINPYNNEKVPLWIADYVLGNYGTGAVMAVPAHDERDFEFAKKYDLPIKQVIAKNIIFTGESAVRKGVETLNRNVVDVILENCKGEILLIEENNPKDYHFIGGGIEEGDSEIVTVFKETKEESGYENISLVGGIEGTYIYSEGFRHTKQKNQKTCGRFFHVILNSDSKIGCEVDDGHHGVLWVQKDKVLDYLTWDAHKNAWNIFLNGYNAFTEDGKLVNSGNFDGLTSSEARQKLTEFAEKNGFGKKKVNYKLRDWLFSRQRYWGEPIPLIHIELADLKKLPHIDNISQATDKNLAYILKRQANLGESCDRVSCGCGHIRELVINGKVFSKIYDGIYTKIVCDYTLPLELPEVETYEPAGDGNSPLSKVDSFVNIKLAENLVGKRETNTMPQWGGSCWYYLRYMDSHNSNELVNKDVEKYWGQVDSYVGGAEHAVLHLLYSRFWHKFLFDIGVVSNDEPFYRLKNQGLILSYAYERKNGGLVAVDEVEEKDGKYFEIKTGEELNKIISKMSKSLKNVVNPDDIVAEYGADSLRLYEMYMADFKDSAPWDSKNIIGVRRFLDRVNSIFTGELEKFAESDEKSMKILHKTIKKVGEDIENYKFNTAIAQMMICVNEGFPKDEKLQNEWKEKFVIILHPFAPHLAEELWEKLGEKNSILFASWPKYDEKLVVDDTIIIGVQVLGKLRGEIEIGIDEEQSSVLEKARNNEGVKKWLEGKEILKEIYVKGKIVNIVVK